MTMRKMLFVLPLLFLAACASSPDVQWAQATSAFNEAKRQLIVARKPCVDSPLKEADPGCLVKADRYPYADAVVRRGDAILAAWEAGAPVRDAAINGLLDSAAEIVALIPRK